MKHWKLAATLASLVGLAACNGGSGSAGSNAGQLSLSAATTGTATPAASGAGLDLGNGIVLTRVRLSVARIELDDTAGHDVKAGPVLVDLSAADLSGGIHTAFDSLVAPGDYTNLEVLIAPVSAAQAPSGSPLAALAAANASFILDGTIDGAAFEFTSSQEVRARHEGCFVVLPGTGATSNLTLGLDPGKWFGGPGGQRLDPRDPAAQAAIVAAMQGAVRCFADHDHDGRDDDAERACSCPEAAPGADQAKSDHEMDGGASMDGGMPMHGGSAEHPQGSCCCGATTDGGTPSSPDGGSTGTADGGSPP